MNTLLIAKTLLGCLTRNLRISRDAARNLSQILVESKADVAARARCFSPPPSHHLSLTICLCRRGETALTRAIDNNKADVAAYLRSIGASE
jgi:hypothetical protein